MALTEIMPVIVTAIILIAIAILFSFVPFMLWIAARVSGVKISIFSLVRMRFKRIDPQRVVYPLIKAQKAGIEVSMSKLTNHHLAGGHVDRVVDALIAARRAKVVLTFERGAELDLAGRDVLEAVQSQVTP